MISQSSIASGIRRVEALRASQLEKFLENKKLNETQATKKSLDELDRLMKEFKKIKVKPNISNNLTNEEKIKILTKKLKDETVKLILLDKELNTINDKVKNGINIRLQKIKDFPTYALRQVIDQGKKDIKKGIIVAFCNFEGKVGVAIGITSDLTSKFDAVKLVKIASEVLGGKGGGGRKDFAQAGGEDQNKIDDAFNKILKEIN